MWNVFKQHRNKQGGEVDGKETQDNVSTGVPEVVALTTAEGEVKTIEVKAEDNAVSVAENPVAENSIVENDASVKTEAKKTEIKILKYPRIRGNDYCPCGSNKKFKKCCISKAEKVKEFQKTMNVKA